MNLSHERFIGFLIEPYAGSFPLWLAPDQVRVITLNDDEALINYAKPIVTELRANKVRVHAGYSATPQKWSSEHCSASGVGIWVWECRITRSNAPSSGSSSVVATWKPAR